jgi:5'-nucleotidase
MTRAGLAVTSVAFAALLGCNSTSSTTAATSSNPSSTASTGGSAASAGPGTTVGRPLRILVTNDDGVHADGIDTVVEALRQEPNVAVTVVAPLENQSGTGGATTPGTLAVTDTTTKSGYPAKAVAGHPADTVIWSLNGGIPDKPDLVVSGSNIGQNLGPVIDVSGTVGAARAGARAGIPSVAISQGIAASPDWPAGTKVLLDWFRANRSGLGNGAKAPDGVLSFNIPTCPAGTTVRGVKEEPAAKADGRDYLTVNCASTQTDFKDDVDAFVNGYATQSVIPIEPA